MSKETIGITDGGGRGAALVDAYSRSPGVGRIIATPGNDLMSLNVQNGVQFDRLPSKLAVENGEKIAILLAGNNVTLADVCQDDVVAGGGVNFLRDLNVPTVGPTKEAGRLEWDKAWSRDFMARNGIPHPAYYVFTSPDEGIAFVRQQTSKQWVIKASGLALGKGVYVTSNPEEAEQAIRDMSNFGQAGTTYLIEERMEGEEASLFAACDGVDFQILGSAQDHKCINDGDEGPNTGGMGCSSSPLVLTPDIMLQVQDVLRKTVDGMAREGNPYTGVLYLGAMIVNGQLKVVEFNSRWGDPEAEVIVPGIQTDMLEISFAIIEQRIGDLRLKVDKKVRVAVALAAAGYPGTSLAAGKEIFGIDDARKQPGVTVYGAGVTRKEGHDFASGGRLLYVVGEGVDVNEARDIAYDGMDRISVEEELGHFRKDIGYRDVKRLNSQS